MREEFVIGQTTFVVWTTGKVEIIAADGSYRMLVVRPKAEMLADPQGWACDYLNGGDN